MSPVDAIRPPKRTKKTKDTAELRPVPPPDRVATPASQGEPAAKPVMPPARPTPTANKQRTVILTVVAIMAVIFIAWMGLFVSGKLTGDSGSSGLGGKFADQLQNLWQTIKTDILKIKNTTTNVNTNLNDEQIRNLENSVFPQFNDPSRQ